MKPEPLPHPPLVASALLPKGRQAGRCAGLGTTRQARALTNRAQEVAFREAQEGPVLGLVPLTWGGKEFLRRAWAAARELFHTGVHRVRHATPEQGSPTPEGHLRMRVTTQERLRASREATPEEPPCSLEGPSAAQPLRTPTPARRCISSRCGFSDRWTICPPPANGMVAGASLTRLRRKWRATGRRQTGWLP